ncbi:MAG: hypothetical protein EGMGGAKC_01069 [Dehalococcoides mccartyi]|nr:hypothetical protein [Dehalococcoides mccartyi]
MKYYVNAGKEGSQQYPEGVGFKAEGLAFAQSDYRNSPEAEEYAQPAGRSEFIFVEKSGQQNTKYWGRCNNEAGGAGGYGFFAVVEGEVIQAYAYQPQQKYCWQIPFVRQAHPGYQGVYDQSQRCHQETQECQVGRAVVCQAYPYGGKG